MTLKRFSTAWMITIVCAALALTGCGGTDAPDAGTDAGTEVPAAETERGTDVSVDAKDGDGTELPAETAPETAAPATGSVTEPETQPDTGETGSVTLYQLAPDANSLTMGYVIRTEHNKLIVIDGGGYDGVSLKDTPSYLPAALRAIAGAGEDGYFEVEAWFLTHAHVDHIYELSKLLRDYSGSSGFAIRNIYFDFPDFDEGTYAGYGDDFRLSGLRDNLNAYGTVIGAEAGDGLDYYDTVNASVINEAAIRDGLSFDIDGVRIDVLQTWSEKDGVSNFNDTSLVMRVTAGGQSILFLGDAGVNAGKRLVNTYGDGLKSDIVQMAHHGQGGVNGLCYAAIDAQVQLWPTPVWVWKNESGKYQIDTNIHLIPYTIIQDLQVTLWIIAGVRELIVSQRRSVTLSREAKHSLRKPRRRMRDQTCSMGFISGV